MSPAIFDDELARRLNDVPLPADLLPRLRALALADERDMDDALVNVPLPADLLARCRGAARPATERAPAAATPDPATLDFGLWTLDFQPAGVRTLTWPPLRRAAAAAAVFLVGIGYTLSVVAFVAPRFEQRAWAGEGRTSLMAVSQLADPFVEQMTSELESPVDLEFSSIDDDDLQEIRKSAPQVRAVAAIGKPMALAAASYASYSVPTFDSPAFSRLAARTSERAALRVPDPRRFNNRFFRQMGLLPWLECADAASVETPLVFTDAGYRFLRQHIQSGLLPRLADIHAEEIVAAIDYGLSNDGITGPALLLSAAPSPFTWPGQSTSTEDAIIGAGAPHGRGRWLAMIAAILPPDVETSAASFKFKFSLDHVVRYRIVGYAPPSSYTGSESHDGGEEMGQFTLSGRAAVTLCEIEIAADCDPRAALLEVRLAGTTRGRPIDADTAVLRAEEFAADFDAAPVAWRQAALAALAAELLAGSPFAEQCSLAEITAIARQIEPLVCDRAGWREFIDTLVRAQTLRSSLLRAF